MDFLKLKREEVNGIVDCDCGLTHDGKIEICVDVEIKNVVKGLKETGRVLIIASVDIDKSYLDSLHESLASDYEVSRFCSLAEEGYERIEGVDVIVAVGDGRLVSRCKLLAHSYDTSLVVVSSEMDYGSYYSSVSQVEYGDTEIVRPSRLPDCIVVDTRLLLSLSKSRWADNIGEVYSRALAIFDYAYRSKIKGDGCDYIVQKAFEILEDGLECFDKNPQNVLKLVNTSIAVASIYKMTGRAIGGGEQVERTIARFSKNRERKGVGRGEVKFLSSIVVGRLYVKFLSSNTNFSVWDVYEDMDKSRRLLGLDELEVVRLAKEVRCDVSDYKDFRLRTQKGELLKLAKRCDDILTKVHYKLMRIYPDGGYHIRYYLTSEEIMRVLECAPFFTGGDTLLTFIKGCGMLTLTSA